MRRMISALAVVLVAAVAWAAPGIRPPDIVPDPNYVWLFGNVYVGNDGKITFKKKGQATLGTFSWDGTQLNLNAPLAINGALVSTGGGVPAVTNNNLVTGSGTGVKDSGLALTNAGGTAAFSGPVSASAFVGTADRANALPASLSGIVKATAGTLSAAAAGTDYAPATSGTAMLKGNGSGGFSAGVAGTDYLAPSGSGAGLSALNASAIASGTVADDRLSVKVRAAASGPVTLIKSGDYLYIRTDWTSTYDLAQKVKLNATGTAFSNNNLNLDSYGIIPVGTADADVPGTAFTQTFGSGSDDAAPIQINGTYIGANHGANFVQQVTATAHGKSAVDVGSEWTDADGTKWYIIRIVDANTLWLLSEDTGAGDAWAFDTSVATKTNLLNPADCQDGKIRSYTNGTLSVYAQGIATGLIPVPGPGTYTFSLPSTESFSSSIAWMFWDGAQSYLGLDRTISTNPVCPDVSTAYTIADGRKKVTITVTNANVRYIAPSTLMDYAAHTTDDFNRIANAAQFESGAYLTPVAYGTPEYVLSHSAGATNTALFSGTAATTTQLLPATKHHVRTVLLDAVTPVTADGVYKARSVDVAHTYDVSDVPAILAYLVANVGSDPAPSFDDASIDNVARMTQTYRFNAEGACTVLASVEVQKEATLSYMGFVQAAALTVPAGGTLWEEVPGVADFSIGGNSYTLSAGQNITSLPETLELTAARWSDANTPPARFIQYTKTSGGTRDFGLTVGYNTRLGLGQSALRQDRVSSAGFIYTSKKQYPKGVTGSSTTYPTSVPAGTVLDMVAFRSPINYTDNPNATNVSWYDVGDDTYVMLDYHATFAGYVALPERLAGRAIETVETGGTITIGSRYVTQDGVYVSVTDAGSAVLRLSPKVDDLSAYAPKASPTFTGTVTAPAFKATTGAGAGKVPVSDASGNLTLTAQTATLQAVLDGGGSVLTSGNRASIEIPYACTITTATLLADVSGSASVRVYNSTYAAYDGDPTDLESGETLLVSPSLSGAVKGQTTGLSIALTAGDILTFNLDGDTTTLTNLTISLKVTKS